VRRATYGREAIRVIRPYGHGLHRARPPLAVLLYLAGREGRLVRESEDAFAVVEPPVARVTEWATGPYADRMLGRVTRWWDHLVFLVTGFVLLLVALPIALVSRSAALLAVLASVSYVALNMVAMLVKGSTSLARSMGTNALDDELRSYHWIMTLCHAVRPDDVERLVRGSLGRSAELAEALPRDRAFGTVALAWRTSCVTTPESRRRLEESDEFRVGTADWNMRRPSGEFRKTRTDAVRPARFIPLLVVTAAVVIAVQAQTIAETERAACPAGACGDRPVTFSRAVTWLLRHVALQFPGPATWRSHVLGVLTAMMIFVVVLCMIVAVVRLRRYQREQVELMYEAFERHGPGKSVLILVVNDIEWDSVVAAAAEHTNGSAPRTDRVGEHAVFRLPRIGSAEVILSRSQQGSGGARGMAFTARSLLDALKPDWVILTGICYGLKSRELDGGDQEIGDLVVSTQLLPVDHRKVTVGPDGARRDILRAPRPEASISLRSHAEVLTRTWTGPAVHRGIVVSMDTLLDNQEERDRLKQLAEEAVGGEMELAGVYDAAVATKTDWLMVKGISDWGVGKNGDHQRRAARNAADFVVRLIEQIAPGTGRRGVMEP
jgi:nucleoside phosphorylase